jgi:signal transduction histidine kinase
VLTILLENSRQAGARRIEVAVELSNDTVQLTVDDDGRGLESSDRGRIFEPFFTTRRGAGGTGLGLAIARSLLESCRGSIHVVEHAPGARFSIVLPRSRH